MIKIPIRRHLLKYLLFRIGTTELSLKRQSNDEIMQLDEDERDRAHVINIISNTIHRCLVNREDIAESPFIADEQYDVIGLRLSDNMIKNHRYRITKRGIISLNEQVYSLFQKHFCSYMDQSIGTRVKIQYRILDFMNLIDLDENDIRMDSLKKIYYRYRQQSHSFSSKNSVRDNLVLDLSFSDNMR